MMLTSRTGEVVVKVVLMAVLEDLWASRRRGDDDARARPD